MIEYFTKASSLQNCKMGFVHTFTEASSVKPSFCRHCSHLVSAWFIWASNSLSSSVINVMTAHTWDEIRSFQCHEKQTSRSVFISKTTDAHNAYFIITCKPDRIYSLHSFIFVSAVRRLWCLCCFWCEFSRVVFKDVSVGKMFFCSQLVVGWR